MQQMTSFTAEQQMIRSNEGQMMKVSFGFITLTPMVNWLEGLLVEQEELRIESSSLQVFLPPRERGERSLIEP